MDVEVIRNKNMASIHMKKEKYEEVKGGISETPVYDEEEVIIKCTIEN